MKPKFDNQTLLASEMLGVNVHKKEKRSYTVTEKCLNHPRGFKPGQSGNPKGRVVKNVSIVKAVIRRLENNPEEIDDIAQALINMAKKTSLTQLGAIQEMMNRVDGKVAETHKIEGELPIRLIFMPATQFLQGEIVEGQARELIEGEQV